MDTIIAALTKIAIFYAHAPALAWLALCTPLLTLVYVYGPVWADRHGWFWVVTRARAARLFAVRRTAHITVLTVRVAPRCAVSVGRQRDLEH